MWRPRLRGLHVSVWAWCLAGHLAGFEAVEYLHVVQSLDIVEG
jgi:hypothetical protein